MWTRGLECNGRPASSIPKYFFYCIAYFNFILTVCAECVATFLVSYV